MSKNKKVFVGMSGGVDSSVTAALLVEQGYEVVGVYMKNWSKDLPGFPCPWKEDYQDAKRVAVKLGIPFEMWDFETEYFDKVVQYMIDGFKSGITPNPDIMCNQEIKFKLFYKMKSKHAIRCLMAKLFRTDLRQIKYFQHYVKKRCRIRTRQIVALSDHIIVISLIIDTL